MQLDISPEISPKDTMYEGNRDHYFAVGDSALHCVKGAMHAVRKDGAESILDFACGFGRVLRVLKAAFPDADLTACDISPDAIDFCSKALGARPVLSSEIPEEIRFEKSFDMIWCGSLLTHFDPPGFARFLKYMYSLLLPDGILMFTTHGPFVARRFRAQVDSYGLDEKAVATLLKAYDSTGFGYVDYPNNVLGDVGVAKYGLSVSTPSWVCRQIEALPNSRLIAYTERSWDNHQDFVACTRSATTILR